MPQPLSLLVVVLFFCGLSQHGSAFSPTPRRSCRFARLSTTRMILSGNKNVVRGRHSMYYSMRLESSSSPLNNNQNDEDKNSIRSKLRELTGFSLSALRTTMRATTGFSLTTLRAVVRASTGISVTQTMKNIIGIFPAWFRYFLQPFLIMYYVPLLIVRNLVGPTKSSRAEAMAAHELVVDGYRKAVEAAEGAQKGGYRPIHVNAQGIIEANFPPTPESVLSGDYNIVDIDVTDAIIEAVERRNEEENI